MKPATVPEHQGVYAIDPGGPGASAQDFVANFQATGWKGSTSSVSTPTARVSRRRSFVAPGSRPTPTTRWTTPDGEAERAALLKAQADFNDQCRANSGPLLDRISTIEAIYDYDLARHLLGEPQLNFYGVSYGTFLGAVYAELYPQNVGRMVLDSAVNLTPSTEVIQAQGFDTSMRNFTSWCAQNPAQCRLGTTEQAVIDKVTGFIKGLDAAPLPTSDPNRPLTQSLAVSGLVLYFYFGAEMYSSLAELLQHTMTSGDGTYLLAAADLLN